jgi:hypothetical protein
MNQLANMKKRKHNKINSKYNIPLGVLPLGANDWKVINIENNVSKEFRKVKSECHQTEQLLVNSFYKPISQLSTIEEWKTKSF